MPLIASRFLMPRPVAGLFAAVLLLPAAGRLMAAMPQAAPTLQFPTLTADAMDKTTVTIPTQLEGRQNLLVLSWARNQQAQSDSWTPVAQALQHLHPDARAYTVLVSTPENILYRWWDNASLRAAQSDPELQHLTLALYTDTTALRQAINIPDEHEVSVLLVDRSGHILWKSEGALTEPGRNALLAAANRTH